MKKNIVHFIQVLLIATLFTMIFLFPVVLNFSTHLTSRADGVFISWTTYTVTKLLSEGKNIFEMPIFFPYKNTLAYSDPFLSVAFLTLPLLSGTSNPIEIHNFHLLLGTVVLYISCYFLGKQLRFSSFASHTLAFFFTFSSIQTTYLVHLHTYLIAGLPLVFLFFLGWIESNKWHWLLATYFTFLFQTLNSPMNGFFILFAITPLLLNKAVITQVKRNWHLIMYYNLLFTIVLLLFFYPYILISKEFRYTRTIRDTAHFSFGVDRLFMPDLLLDLSLLIFLYLHIDKNYLFRCKNVSNKTKALPESKRQSCQATKLDFPVLSISTIGSIGMTGALLMLGPVIKLFDETLKIFGLPIPLPYAVLYYIVPGFKAFRASSRWIILLNFCFALLFGSFIQHSKLKSKIQYVIIGMLLLTQLYFHFSKFELYKIPTDIPKIYQVVKNRPESVLAEFPVFSWRMMPYAYLENDRLLYQSYHEKKLYNGVSGFTPPQLEKDWDQLWSEFPNKNTLQLLHESNVQLLLIHYDLYEEMDKNNFSYNSIKNPNLIDLQTRIEQFEEEILLITCIEKKCLYSLNDSI